MSATELATLQSVNPIELFTPKGVDTVLAQIIAEARAAVLDISTAEGRKQVASLAYKIAKSKTFLDDAGKSLVAEWKSQSKVVDDERKRIRETLDALKDEVRKPLTEWENAEKERVAGHERVIEAIAALVSVDRSNANSDAIVWRLESLDSLYAREWQEFAKRAEGVRDTTRATLVGLAEELRKREAEAAELARLRKEEEDRKRREREDRIRADAAAKAKAEAEEAARIEANREAVRVEAEAKREALRVKAEAEKAEKARLAIEAEKVEAERRAEKAEAARVAAEAKALAEAKAAVESERRRVEAARQEAEQIAAKKAADKRHRTAVEEGIIEALASIGVNRPDAEDLIEHINQGAIPHVKITY